MKTIASRTPWAAMLLAGFRQFNLAVGVSLAVVAGTSSAADADEVRRWRDEEGRLHVTITGSPDQKRAEARDTEASGAADPGDRFSVEASLRRRDLEKRLRAASAELAHVRARIDEIKSKHLVVYSPPAPKDGEDSQFALDAQRNAFLQVRAFERERRDELRKLRRRERDQLVEIRSIWSDFDGLREEVRNAYDGLPAWWRDHLDCPGCLTAAEAEEALARPAKKRSDSDADAHE